MKELGLKTKSKIRVVKVDGELAFVTLTRGYVAVIDSADANLFEGFNWSADVRARNVYAYRHIRVGRKRQKLYMHRVVYGPDSRQQIDHINHDGLDNRRANLRGCSPAENQRNMRIPAHNTSGFKGVCWSKKHGKWKAEIRWSGKRKHIGLFDCAEDAHEAYCVASEKYHGEFGCAENKRAARCAPATGLTGRLAGKG
jgi:hypothetical protein